MACLKVTVIALKLERIPRLETMAAGSLRYHSHGTQRDLGCEGYKGYIPAQATVGREIKLLHFLGFTLRPYLEI
jgi:hypothetical protein